MAENIVILTGAGISAESGLGTFRDKDGAWAKFDWRKLASPEGYSEDPIAVHEFYNARRRGLLEAQPHGAHQALAQWEAAHEGEFLLVTQNIDDLHLRAGSKNLIPMHGELFKARCSACHHVYDWREDLSVDSQCPHCQTRSGPRPHVVWFGEMPLEMERIYRALEHCTLFVAIGTSGTVYPAAGFVQDAKAAGAHTIELCLEPGEISVLFDEAIYGPASEVVPHFVATYLTPNA